MKTVAAVLAAGAGTRFGADKVEADLGGKPVWRWSINTFLAHPEIAEVILVTGPEKVAQTQTELPRARVIAGGNSRQESSARAVEAMPQDADVLLIHDAARPFVTAELIDRVIAGVREAGAAAPVVPVVDTIRSKADGSVLDRSSLIAMQTPQGATASALRQAHAHAQGDETDDIALLQRIGVPPVWVAGDPQNFKITELSDLHRARSLITQGETRIGFGYDVHAFSSEPLRPLWLGGIQFPDHPGLEGHSDADVLLHAITDALLGAAALGDIGQHFPNTDPAWHNAPSDQFLRHASDLLRATGWAVVNLDATVLAESPKIMPKAEEIRARIAAIIGVKPELVSVKATTHEGLGAIGRGEGIVAQAVASIRR